MLLFQGKTLIERQVETLRSCGIKDIVIITGYRSNKIKIKGTKYYKNKNFSTTNMVESLFVAEKELSGNILLCYGDIIYTKSLLKKILKNNADIGVTADEDYWDYWKARLDEPKNDIESFVLDKDKNIIELGSSCKRNKAKFRYVGIIKFSNKGIEILKYIYQKNKKLYFKSNRPWLGSKSFRQAFMTSLLQAIINSNYKVKPILIKRGWLEFDTTDDYERANSWAKEKNLKRFIDLKI